MRAATEEEERLDKELTLLESSLAKDPPQQPPTMSALRDQLSAAVEELMQFDDISPEVISDAETKTDNLLKSFEMTIRAAQQAQEV
eukprot:7692456-Pyramimonas_sp.AAC.1